MGYDIRGDMIPFTIRQHWSAVVLALVIGVICAAPFYYFASTPEYRGIVMMGNDAEDHYLARMKEVYEGHLSLGNTFLPNKDQSYFVPSGGEILASGVGKLSGQSATDAEMLNKFIFPFLIALVLYALGYSISRSRGAGLLSAATVLLGDGALISGFSPWKNLMRGITANINFLGYTRPINPEVSGLILMLGLLLSYRIFLARTARSWESIVLAFVFGGALYVSPFTYSFLGMFLFLLFVWLIWSREKILAFRAFAIGGVALLSAIPFYLNYHALTMASAYVDSAMRQGLVVSRAPIVGWWLPLMLLAAIFFWPKRYAQARPLFITAALALLILLNQQIITGHIIQPGHYHWYITVPLVFIMLSLYATYVIGRFFQKGWWRTTLFALGVVVFIYSAVLTQISSYQAWLPTTVAAQAYAPVLKVLDAIPGEQVAWANPDMAMYIPIYTNKDSPGDGQLGNYLVPFSFMEERMFLIYRLRGITAADALATMQRERAYISSMLYSLYWLHKTGSFEGIPDATIADVANDYRKQYALPVRAMFEKLGVTMIVWNKTVDPQWHIDTLPFVQKVYAYGSLEVYTIR